MANQKKADPDPDPTITTETTAALHGDPVAEDTAPPAPVKVHISEGMRTDLLVQGSVIDPATGLLVKLDPDTGKLTATHRGTGEVTEL